jgi:hypothetical protein
VALTASLPAQSVVHAKAGLVSYAGEAYVDDRLVEISPVHFFAVNVNAVLRTGSGRAEVLLGPCAAMWVDDHSSFRMVSNALSDARIEVLTGSVIVASGEMVKGSKLMLTVKALVAALNPKGAYRFDTEPARVKVLAGTTTVHLENQTVSLTAGRFLLDELPPPGKFDRRNPDPLEKWSNNRAARMAPLQTRGTRMAGRHPCRSMYCSGVTVPMAKHRQSLSSTRSFQIRDVGWRPGNS